MQQFIPMVLTFLSFLVGVYFLISGGRALFRETVPEKLEKYTDKSVREYAKTYGWTSVVTGVCATAAGVLTLISKTRNSIIFVTVGLAIALVSLVLSETLKKKILIRKKPTGSAPTPPSTSPSPDDIDLSDIL